jgi:hypothetical protein
VRREIGRDTTFQRLCQSRQSGSLSRADNAKEAALLTPWQLVEGRHSGC